MPKPALTMQQIFTARFEDGGRGELGADHRPQLDCWGLVMALFAMHGVIVPDFEVGAHDTDAKDAAYRSERGSGRWVELDRPEVPCLVAMRTCARAPRATNHFGVYVGDDTVLHIFDVSGVHRSTLSKGPKLAPNVSGLWRFIG